MCGTYDFDLTCAASRVGRDHNRGTSLWVVGRLAEFRGACHRDGVDATRVAVAGAVVVTHFPVSTGEEIQCSSAFPSLFLEGKESQKGR